MKNKLSTTILSALIFVSACSGQKGGGGKGQEATGSSSPSSSASTTKMPVEIAEDSDLLDAWINLVKDEKVSFKTLDILSSEVVSKNKVAVSKIVKSFSSDDLTRIQGVMEKEENRIKRLYLFKNMSWVDSEAMMVGALVDLNKNSVKVEDSYSSDLVVSVATQERDDFLVEIMGIYDRQLSKLQKDLANDFIAEIASNRPQDAKAIENSLAKGKGKAIHTITKVIEGLAVYNDMCAANGIGKAEQAGIMAGAGISALIAGQVYEHVKHTKTFADAIKLYEKGQDIHTKFKEFHVLYKSLNSYADNMEQNTAKMKDSLENVSKSISSAFENIKQQKNIPGFNNKKALKDLYGIMTGKELNPSTYSTSKDLRAISQSLGQLTGDALSVSNNFNSILNTTMLMSKKLGLPLSKDIQKLSAKAEKVQQAVALAQGVAMGFASGGAFGVMKALASGPGAQLLGGGFESAVMARFDQMDQKLNKILHLQQQMIDLQIETMNMIRSLALMIDQYHQEEMAALASLRNISLINLEMDKVQLNLGVNRCEQMVTKYLNDLDKVEDPENFEVVLADSEYLFSKLKTFEDVNKFLRSTSPDDYSSCQLGISKAFGKGRMSENPILSIYSSDGKEDLKKFYEEQFLPLASIVNKKAGDSSTLSMGLHIPMRKFQGIIGKHALLTFPDGNDKRDDYDLDHLISPLALKRYAAQLLTFYPYLELDKNEWKDIDHAFEKYGQFATGQTGEQGRAMFFLKNALHLTQSAIAQEAILSGEPILNDLRIYLRSYLMSEKPCSKDTYNAEACAVLSNGLLLRNLMIYSLRRTIRDFGGTESDYEAAYNSKDIVKLEKLIFNDKVEGRIVDQDGVLRFNSGIVMVKVPSPKDIEENELLYSENMAPLLKLQDKLADALVKVTPLSIEEHKEDLGLLILSKKMN